MSLKDQLAEYRAGWYQRVPAERQAIMRRHIQDLRSGTIARTMLKVGDNAPAIVLENAVGETVDMAHRANGRSRYPRLTLSTAMARSSTHTRMSTTATALIPLMFCKRPSRRKRDAGRVPIAENQIIRMGHSGDTRRADHVHRSSRPFCPRLQLAVRRTALGQAAARPRRGGLVE
jgi:hypothetical protein